MANRKRAGVSGIESPRCKDMPKDAGISRRKVTKDADRLAKRQVRHSLADWLAAQGADGPTVVRWVRHYGALVRGLPSDSVSVRDLVSSRVRNAYMAETSATEATAVGVTTVQGAKLLEASHRADMMTQRYALHARDLAYREAGVPTEGGSDTGGLGGITLDQIEEARLAIAHNRAITSPEFEAQADAGVFPPREPAFPIELGTAPEAPFEIERTTHEEPPPPPEPKPSLCAGLTRAQRMYIAGKVPLETCSEEMRDHLLRKWAAMDHRPRNLPWPQVARTSGLSPATAPFTPNEQLRKETDATKARLAKADPGARGQQ